MNNNEPPVEGRFLNFYFILNTMRLLFGAKRSDENVHIREMSADCNHASEIVFSAAKPYVKKIKQLFHSRERIFDNNSARIDRGIECALEPGQIFALERRQNKIHSYKY